MIYTVQKGLQVDWGQKTPAALTKIAVGPADRSPTTDKINTETI